MSEKGQEKLATTGMEKEVLIEFYKEVFDGITLMNRRQRWQFRRDMKEYCRLVNVRYPYGKPEDLNVSDDGGNSGRILQDVPPTGGCDASGTLEDHGRVNGEAKSEPDNSECPKEIGARSADITSEDEIGC